MVDAHNHKALDNKLEEARKKFAPKLNAVQKTASDRAEGNSFGSISVPKIDKDYGG
jgi:hypothetical protein